eukprot:6115192-Prorocentrum_lima.AAC.1
MGRERMRPISPHGSSWTFDMNGKKRRIDYLWCREGRQKDITTWMEHLVDWTGQTHTINYH